MISYKEPENLNELIFQISARPAMFVGWNDYSKAASFIDGYAYAKSQLGTSNDMETLKTFSLWLAIKLNKPQNWAWSRIIKDYYNDDEIALEYLPNLFKEFLHQG